MSGLQDQHLPTVAVRCPAKLFTATLRIGVRLGLVVLCLLGQDPWQAANAQWFAKSAEDRSSPDEAIQDSLRGVKGVPWYSEETGGIRPIAVEPRFDDSVNRSSRWLPKPPAAKPPKAQASAGTQSETQSPVNPNQTGVWQLLRQLVQDHSTVIAWGLFLLVLALLIAILVYGWTKIEDRQAEALEGDGQERLGDLGKGDLERLEHLPEEVRQAKKNLLSEADRLWQNGQVDQAIIFLFGHRLLQLDRAGAIRLSRGKTNQQYLRELGTLPKVHRALGSTVGLFERSYFGRYPIESIEFEEIRNEQTLFDEFLATKKGQR